ncbi:MAG: Type secretion system effector, Hcp [Verrucomicrobiota bacterium]|jgi:type VI protein secretion system component Hcp|nr:Type secretion system effector, Hcp [Verrucomicrobiota bacterium]
MTTEKNENGKPAVSFPVETRDGLTDGALEKVSGGDIHFTKVIDKSSPVLFQKCATG